MLRINYRKNIRKYKPKEKPEFDNLRLEYMWAKNQHKESMLFNIKSVDVQVKDIKKMYFSDDSALICLYSKFAHLGLEDEEYITFSKTKRGNDRFIYSLITSFWILNEAQLEEKDVEELKEEIMKVRKRINDIMQSPKIKRDLSLKNRVVLLEYMQNELSKYLNKKQKQNREGTPIILQKRMSSKKNN